MTQTMIAMILTLCGYGADKVACQKYMNGCVAMALQREAEHLDGDGSERGLEIPICFARMPKDAEPKKARKERGRE